MAKAHREKEDPQETIRQLRATIAAQQNTISLLQKTGKIQELIPKPKGQAGRSEEAGGYNLKEAMGLKDHDEDYNRRCRIVKRYVHEYLSVFMPLSKQKSGYEARMIAKIKQEVPFFKKFENGWPIHEIARIYLSNEQTRRRADLDEENEAYTEPDTESSAQVKKNRVTFATDNEEEEADNEGEGEVKSKIIVKKWFPSKQRSTVILSDDDTESDDSSDLDRLLRPSAPAIKPHKVTPASKVCASYLAVYFAKSSQLQQKSKTKENKPPSGLKRKMDNKAEMPASKKAKLAPAKTLITPPPSTKKTSNTVLAWSDLPNCCPAALCNDHLPAVPVPRILSLFQKHQNLLDKGGPRAKGLAFTELELCHAITTETRRTHMLDLGKTRGWPTKISAKDIRDRIFTAPLNAELLDLITKPEKLKTCPTFRDFLLSINFRLLPFIKSNTHREFLDAIKHKTCGYYGPQGQMIIFSYLLRFVAANEDVHDLENSLFSTMFTIIGDDEDDQFDDLHTLYDDSCCLRMEDFVDFVLVPFVATFLIAQDLPTQDASFEKESSAEYGELVNPEDDADEEASQVHEENEQAVRRVERARENPLIPVSAIESTAPLRHRKKSEQKKEPVSLKIRLPAHKTLEEEEITLSDYEAPQPKPRKERVKPEKKDKGKQKASKKATGQSTTKTSHLTIKTRSRTKVDEDDTE
ncbi:hypothetical protein K438DRAFT_1796499 [Mycena galopus ATCC 62051]|nr:hypothetical protein K438DRAFT_1796499 [Mycena galopus ATCC 62051]